ncbi:MAG: hypothetical protein IKO93_13080 [Lentisphaeria bacterium]|nr:hypothetical protein [Lentisphaeria bacterium]
MKKIFAMLMLAGLASLVNAGDLVIKTGAVYKNYVIMGAAPKGIRVFYNNGEGDREVILPVNQFPDELKDTVNRFARKIPEEQKKAQAEAQQARADKAKNTQRAKAAKARQKKSADLVKKEQEANKKLQEDMLKKSPKGKMTFKK